MKINVAKYAGDSVSNRFLIFKTIASAIIFVLLMFGSSACESKTDQLVNSVGQTGELTVINNLHQIFQAEQMYSIPANNQFGTFDELVQGNYLDQRFKGQKPVLTNYVYTLNVKKGTDGTSFYTVNADPNSPQAGTKHFYTDSASNLIKVSETGAATASSKIVN